MKLFFKYFLLYELIFLLLLYVMSIKEGMDILNAGSFSLVKSFRYYFLWVLPYWFVLLIFVSVLFSIITVFIIKLIKKLKVK